jgi:peptide/nickel transport system substrate-binding protein
MDYTTGTAAQEQQEEILKSDAAQAGIDISVDGVSFDTLLGTAVPTNPNWTMVDISGWAYDGPGYLPTGEPLFLTGGPSNSGSYSDPTVDNLIHEIQDNSSLSVFHQYATEITEQSPVIWVPVPYFIQAVKSNLQGVAANPDYTFLPEYWHFTSNS